MRLRKPCVRCGKMFIPSGKFTRLCNECNPFFGNRKPVCLDEETIRHLKQTKKYKLEGHDKPSDSDLKPNKAPTIKENEKH